jgi:hypothetical protein
MITGYIDDHQQIESLLFMTCVLFSLLNLPHYGVTLQIPLAGARARTQVASFLQELKEGKISADWIALERKLVQFEQARQAGPGRV